MLPSYSLEQPMPLDGTVLLILHVRLPTRILGSWWHLNISRCRLSSNGQCCSFSKFQDVQRQPIGTLGNGMGWFVVHLLFKEPLHLAMGTCTIASTFWYPKETKVYEATSLSQKAHKPQHCQVSIHRREFVSRSTTVTLGDFLQYKS